MKLTAAYEQADEAERIATRQKTKVRSAIKALLAMATDEPLEFAGTLADACRAVFRDSEAPMSPIEARNAIVDLGYNLTQHKNPLASIHSVLKRLAQSGDLKHVVASTKTKDGFAIDKAAYEWNGDRELRTAQRRAIAPTGIGDVGPFTAGFAEFLRDINRFDAHFKESDLGKVLDGINATMKPFGDIQRTLDSLTKLPDAGVPGTTRQRLRRGGDKE